MPRRRATADGRIFSPFILPQRSLSKSAIGPALVLNKSRHTHQGRRHVECALLRTRRCHAPLWELQTAGGGRSCIMMATRRVPSSTTSEAKMRNTPWLTQCAWLTTKAQRHVCSCIAQLHRWQNNNEEHSISNHQKVKVLLIQGSVRSMLRGVHHLARLFQANKAAWLYYEQHAIRSRVRSCNMVLIPIVVIQYRSRVWRLIAWCRWKLPHES